VDRENSFAGYGGGGINPLVDCTTVGEGARTGPTSTMWAAAARDFLPEMSKLRPNPKRLIALGKRMWSKMPGTDIYITDDVQGYHLGEHVMMCSATFEVNFRRAI
jgi:hypothetical protein